MLINNKQTKNMPIAIGLRFLTNMHYLTTMKLNRNCGTAMKNENRTKYHYIQSLKGCKSSQNNSEGL